MPKIVDHDAKRAELGRKAIPVFRNQGYSTTSFRGLAETLGMSKTGLYHYFSNKEELFLYCGSLILEETAAALIPDGSSAVQRCLGFARRLGDEFEAEMFLLLDYRRNTVGREEDGNPLKACLELYERALAEVTGPDRALSVLRLILGELLIRSLGRQTEHDWKPLEKDLRTLLGDDGGRR